MVKIGNMEFSTTIGVLFALKEARGYKTLQQTYKLFESNDLEVMLDILCVAYNKQNKVHIDGEQFIELLEQNNIGFVRIGDIYSEVVEALMFGGLDEEEKEAKKKQLIQQANSLGMLSSNMPTEQV